MITNSNIRLASTLAFFRFPQTFSCISFWSAFCWQLEGWGPPLLKKKLEIALELLGWCLPVLFVFPLVNRRSNLLDARFCAGFFYVSAKCPIKLGSIWLLFTCSCKIDSISFLWPFLLPISVKAWECLWIPIIDIRCFVTFSKVWKAVALLKPTSSIGRFLKLYFWPSRPGFQKRF